MKSVFVPRDTTLPVSVGLLLLRAVVGTAFMFHGSTKITKPFSWMGDAAPGLLQGLAALSEFGGGLALILGLLTPLAAFGIACTMTGAVYLHAVVNRDPFVSMQGGRSYELPLLFLSIMVLFLTAGPGRLSLDRYVFKRRE